MSDMRAVEVLWTARYDYPAGTQLPHHVHNYFQLLHFIEGAGDFYLSDMQQDIAPGTLVLIKPEVRHGFAVTRNTKTLDVKFHVQSTKLRRTLWKCPTSLDTAPRELVNLFLAIAREGQEKGIYYQTMCSTYMVQMLVLYVRQFEGQSMHMNSGEPSFVIDEIVQRAIEFVSKAYSDELSVSQIAVRVGCSERALRKHFQEILGIGPSEHLQRYRVQKAKELIENTDDVMKGIAAQTGFRSVHHFSRLFASIMGMPPATWRRRHRDGICADICIDPDFQNLKGPDLSQHYESRSCQDW